MKRAGSMILLLVIILVSPALLFAADWITQGLQDFNADPFGAIKGGLGAISTGIDSGYKTYISPTFSSINTGLQNNYQTLSAGATKIATIPFSTFQAGVTGYNTYVAPQINNVVKAVDTYPLSFGGLGATYKAASYVKDIIGTKVSKAPETATKVSDTTGRIK